MKKSHMLVLAGMLVISVVVVWFFVFQDYQRERIYVFLNPALDPLGAGYNITQATIAIGAGQWYGKGIGFGSQSQLKFLPESQSDFIFAVIAEELGFIATFLVVLLYGFLCIRLLVIAREVRSNFGLYVVLGVCILFFTQIVINLGMNMGLLPVTGLTLPFMSYGGSSLVSNMIMIGIVESVVSRAR
jgi:rod shape determining protein RodA